MVDSLRIDIDEGLIAVLAGAIPTDTFCEDEISHAFILKSNLE